MENGLIQNEDQTIDHKKREVEIASAIAKGEIDTPDDIADRFGLEWTEAVLLLANPSFLNVVTLLQEADDRIIKMKESRGHLLSVNKLVDTIKNGDLKDAMQAIRDLAKISGKIKEPGVNVNFNLEGMLSEIQGRPKVTLDDEDVTDLFPDEKGTYEKRRVL